MARAMSRNGAANPEDQGISTRENALFAMKIFMASWVLSFFALIGAYLYLRMGAPVWPPDGAPRPPLGLTAASTGIAIASSLVLQSGINRWLSGRPAALGPALAGTAALGFAFLFLQLGVGAQALGRGLLPNLNAYASLFWVTAVFHALHVAVGVVALGVLAIRARRGELVPQAGSSPHLWAHYWHGVDFVWVCIFLVMFVPG